MRKVSVAFRVAAFVAVFSLSAAGQQAPPPVLVDLAVEPQHTQGELTLAGAARSNNYPLFDALYTEAGDDAPAFGELHRFWKWSLDDRLGAFYGQETHARFASRYPGYAAYIADYAIVDSHGNTFYPSAETRSFLLQQAMTRIAPRTEPVKVAKAKPAPATRVAPRTSAPKVAEVVVQQPRVAAAVPASVDARDARRSTQPPARVVVTAIEKPRSTEVPATPPGNRFAPAFALIIAGLVGVGLLTLMLRTPSEEPKEEEPMEPLRIIPLEGKSKKTA